MTQVSTLAAAKGMVKRLPGVRASLEAHRFRHFLSPEGFASHYGVYGSFAEARRNLPPSQEFDDAEVIAGLMNRRMNRLHPYDYPVVFWLCQAFLGGATRVFDLGGSVGVHFHAYRRVLPYPEGLSWQIHEVPAAVAAGREIARRNGETALAFVDALEPTRLDAQVWLSAGALQYFEDDDLGRLLDECPTPPAHLLLNKLPLYHGGDFVAAQNIGPSVYAPEHVYNRLRFIERITARGYELVDAWQVPELGLYLPGHPDKCFESFSGLYFRATAADRS